MRSVYTVFKKEIWSFFVSPVAYFVLTGFYLLSAYFFFYLLQYYNTLLTQFGQLPAGMMDKSPNLNDDVIAPYFQTLMVVLVFFIPILTMRLVSEEKKSGTFEYLAIAPIGVNSIVLGKFLSAALVVFIMLAGSAVFPAFAYLFGSPKPEILPVLSGLLGLILYSFGYIGIGIAASSFTANQLIAAITSIVIMLLLFMIHTPAQSLGGSVGDFLIYLSPPLHCRAMINGVVESDRIVFFASMMIAGMFVSARVMEAQRWR